MHESLSSSLTIPPPETFTEIEMYFRLNAQVFRPEENLELVASHRQRFVVDAPDFHPSQLRCAFLDGACIGGYLMSESWLCFGPTRLQTGCVSAVVTHADYRRRGIATAMMQDAITYAHSNH